jgi:hypothetical protein
MTSWFASLVVEKATHEIKQDKELNKSLMYTRHDG